MDSDETRRASVVGVTVGGTPDRNRFRVHDPDSYDADVVIDLRRPADGFAWCSQPDHEGECAHVQLVRAVLTAGTG